MNKGFIVTEKGFYDPELCIRFMKVKATKTSYVHGAYNSFDYQMILVTRGNFEILCENKLFPLEKGDVFIAKPLENYRIKCFETQKALSFTIITFHQNLFKNSKGDSDFLRAFNNHEFGIPNIYKAKFFGDFSICNSVDLLKSYTDKNLGFIHFLSVVSTIISQLDVAFDNLNTTSSSDTTNDISVKVWDYIVRNCMSMITAKEICEKFFVSKWFVDKVTKQFYGLPFHQTVKSMRMWHAKALMVYKRSLTDISKLCGYTDYSAFYRAYSSCFGVSPKKEYQHFLKNRTFLSDKKNDTITLID